MRYSLSQSRTIEYEEGTAMDRVLKRKKLWLMPYYNLSDIELANNLAQLSLPAANRIHLG